MSFHYTIEVWHQKTPRIVVRIVRRRQAGMARLRPASSILRHVPKQRGFTGPAPLRGKNKSGEIESVPFALYRWSEDCCNQWRVPPY
jgi:hypothetical protein